MGGPIGPAHSIGASLVVLYSGLWERAFRPLCLYTQTERLTIKLPLTWKRNRLNNDTNSNLDKSFWSYCCSINNLHHNSLHPDTSVIFYSLLSPKGGRLWVVYERSVFPWDVSNEAACFYSASAILSFLLSRAAPGSCAETTDNSAFIII